MNRKTKAALEDSIAKWDAIHKGTGKDKGAKNCALCKRFADCFTGNERCPVFKLVGQDSCNGTPYVSWWDHHNKNHREGTALCGFGISRQKGCAQCRRHAKAELEFLKSLREE